MKFLKRNSYIYLFGLGLLLQFCFGVQVVANPNNGKLIQISGVIAGKSIPFLPFSQVSVKNTKKSFVAGNDGFYTITAKELDTLVFSAIGFKKIYLQVKQSSANSLNITYNPVLARDTLELPPVVVTPWLNREQFRIAFLNLRVDDNLNEIAMKNLDPEILRRLYYEMEMDGRETGGYILADIRNQTYYGGGQRNYLQLGNSAIPSSLLNPFAWASFIKAIKNGDYSKKKKKK